MSAVMYKNFDTNSEWESDILWSQHHSISNYFDDIPKRGVASTLLYKKLMHIHF